MRFKKGDFCPLCETGKINFIKKSMVYICSVCHEEFVPEEDKKKIDKKITNNRKEHQKIKRIKELY